MGNHMHLTSLTRQQETQNEKVSHIVHDCSIALYCINIVARYIRKF